MLLDCRICELSTKLLLTETACSACFGAGEHRSVLRYGRNTSISLSAIGKAQAWLQFDVSARLCNLITAHQPSSSSALKTCLALNKITTLLLMEKAFHDTGIAVHNKNTVALFTAMHLLCICFSPLASVIRIIACQLRQVPRFLILQQTLCNNFTEHCAENIRAIANSET